MSLVSSKEIAKVIQTDKFGWLGTFSGCMLLKALRISKLNRIYERHKDKEDIEFLNAILDDFQIHFEIPEEDLQRIPKEGAFITVSNHPLGGIDGILLLKLLIERRPDYKIIANFLLHRILPLKKYVMPVNLFLPEMPAYLPVPPVKVNVPGPGDPGFVDRVAFSQVI